MAQTEKLAKAAEVNLSLQSAQHKRETADLQRELTLLRSQPNLGDAVSELEERNNEMEELLRSKCIEIEENDDRALEYVRSSSVFPGITDLKYSQDAEGEQETYVKGRITDS